MSREIVFSRRNLLVGGAAAAALPTLGFMGASTVNPSTLSAADRKVTVLSASDYGFADKLGQLYPGLLEDVNFQQLAPLAALMTLEEGPGVRALTTCWSVTTPNGVYETALFRYSSPGSKRRQKKGRTVASAQTDILRPGEWRLSTPFFTLSPKNYKKLGKNWHHLVKKVEPGSFLVSELPTATATKVWLDAVVFKDRKVVGADTHQLATRLRVRRNAEHDEARAVLHLLRSGASDADISAHLTARGNVERPSGPKVRRWYLLARRQHALVLEEQRKTLGREAFKKAVRRVTKMHRTRLHKLSS